MTENKSLLKSWEIDPGGDEEKIDLHPIDESGGRVQTEREVQLTQLNLEKRNLETKLELIKKKIQRLIQEN